MTPVVGPKRVVDPLADDPVVAEAEVTSPESVLSDKPTAVVETEPSSPVPPSAAPLSPVEPSPVEPSPAPDALEARKRQLRDAIAAAEAKKPPKRERDLTPEEREVRDLEDQLARITGRNLDDQEDEFLAANPGAETVLIHFLEDGFMAQGRVWYKGQELEFEIGSDAYEQTKDRAGQSWLRFADDEFEQARKFGKVFFRRGPWPGVQYTDDKALAEERRRNRAAPALPVR